MYWAESRGAEFRWAESRVYTLWRSYHAQDACSPTYSNTLQIHYNTNTNIVIQHCNTNTNTNTNIVIQHLTMLQILQD
jgi:hypothetical protein